MNKAVLMQLTIRVVLAAQPQQAPKLETPVTTSDAGIAPTGDAAAPVPPVPDALPH